MVSLWVSCNFMETFKSTMFPLDMSPTQAASVNYYTIFFQTVRPILKKLFFQSQNFWTFDIQFSYLGWYIYLFLLIPEFSTGKYLSNHISTIYHSWSLNCYLKKNMKCPVPTSVPFHPWSPYNSKGNFRLL